MNGKTSIVLLSGGLDSATVLAIAQAEGFTCHALSFDYGQRHDAELTAARHLANHLEVASHEIIKLDNSIFSGSALTDKSAVIPDQVAQGIPLTYVPARNTVFLAHALGFAEVINAQAIHIGVNAVDYSGYPDCRPAFIDAFRGLAAVATKQAVEGSPVEIHAPLLSLTKAEIIQRGSGLGVDYALTVSCYQAGTDGAACRTCDACRFRAKGFQDAGIEDPTRYRN